MKGRGDEDIEVFQPLTLSLGATSDMAERIFQQTVTDHSKQDHSIADLSGQLQRFWPAPSHVDRDGVPEIDQAAIGVEKSDHPPPLALLIE
jgi:hypothetical protein